MTLISATLHFNSKTDKFCCGSIGDNGNCKFEPIKIPYIRLYGSAHGMRKEPKTVLYKCVRCLLHDMQQKITYQFTREIERKLSIEHRDIINQYAIDHAYELGIV